MSERGAQPPPAGMVVTEQQIAEALDSLFRQTNAFSSFNDVVQQLESKLGVNLSHRVDFIRAQIQHLFRLPPHPQTFVTHHPHHPHLHQHDRFALHQTPNFQPPLTAHPSLSFAAHHAPEGYGFRPPPPQPQSSQPQPTSTPLPPPPPQLVAKNPSAPPASAPTKESSSCRECSTSAVAMMGNNPKPGFGYSAFIIINNNLALWLDVFCAQHLLSAPKKRRGGPGGLNKLCGVSPELQTIVGQPALPRTEIVKQLWAYIRKNNLQDPNNKRKIICNDELRLVFETDCTDMFKMNKLLAKHIIALEPTKASNKKPKVEVLEEVVSGSKSDDPVPIVIISEALASFFGTDEKEMSQAEVLRQMWEYIKVNQLEDPLNPTDIICDGKLQELLGCESISALGIPEILAQRCLSKKS